VDRTVDRTAKGDGREPRRVLPVLPKRHWNRGELADPGGRGLVAGIAAGRSTGVTRTPESRTHDVVVFRGMRRFARPPAEPAIRGCLAVSDISRAPEAAAAATPPDVARP
jgi:hypothetical protein